MDNIIKIKEILKNLKTYIKEQGEEGLLLLEEFLVQEKMTEDELKNICISSPELRKEIILFCEKQVLLALTSLATTNQLDSDFALSYRKVALKRIDTYKQRQSISQEISVIPESDYIIEEEENETDKQAESTTRKKPKRTIPKRKQRGQQLHKNKPAVKGSNRTSKKNTKKHTSNKKIS